ncbi:MAG: 2-C-methyl-D-erythritol 2,4-cyclodiphosphate synthase, partial [Pseudomonadota bacterium]
TPQGFAFQRLYAAHNSAHESGETHFTDDSSLMRAAGHQVIAVEGDAVNTKLTTADDMARAEAMFAVPDVRVGHGYDTHQLVPGDSIWLCGVEIPHTHRLSGQSDADVGLHALTDALLATIADGDIGSHFPPSDEKWKGAKSDQFLAHAINLVQQAAGTITHMDVTLVCESPKIGPHRDAMRDAMATITAVDRSRISVKATTNERIGFIGREEGMVALATATVVFGETT